MVFSPLFTDYQKEILMHFLAPNANISLLGTNTAEIVDTCAKETNDQTTMNNFLTFQGPRTGPKINYFGHLKSTHNATVAQYRQLIINVARRAQYYELRSDRSLANLNYSNVGKKNEISRMFSTMPGLDDRLAEYLWAVNIKTASDFVRIANAVDQRDNLGGINANATAQEIFEMILMARDVAPETWYELFYTLEKVCYSVLGPGGPPDYRYP